MKHRCPICNKIIKTSPKEKSEAAKSYPFCSQRCKLVDLGAWLDTGYKIVSGPEPDESGGASDTDLISPVR